MKKLGAVCVFLTMLVTLSVAWCQAEFPTALGGVVPQYPGSIVESSMTNEDGIQVHLEADAEPKAITNYYKKAMVGKGWTVDMEMSNEEGSTLVVNKEGKILNVTSVGTPGERTRFLLLYSSK